MTVIFYPLLSLYEENNFASLKLRSPQGAAADFFIA